MMVFSYSVISVFLSFCALLAAVEAGRTIDVKDEKSGKGIILSVVFFMAAIISAFIAGWWVP